MIITEEKVRTVAALANLTLTDAEIPRMVADLSGILTHMDKLNELNTTGVEPMSQVLFENEETATLRPDEEKPSLSNTEAIGSAAISGNGFFKVPKVIER